MSLHQKTLEILTHICKWNSALQRRSAVIMGTRNFKTESESESSPVGHEGRAAVMEHLGEALDQLHVVAGRQVEVASGFGPEGASGGLRGSVHEDADPPDAVFHRLWGEEFLKIRRF